MAQLIKGTLIIALPATAGYAAGGYIGGSGLIYRSPVQLSSDQRGEPVNQLLHGIVKKTAPRGDSKGITISEFHCSDNAVGFPFMIHGGLLASILKDHADLNKFRGKLTIRYKSPSYINSLLRLESQESLGGLDLKILEGRKTLVEGFIANR